jgi:di/tricarboxylate transporter
MTLQQGLAFGLVFATVVAFAWGRFRYDLVALGALLAGLLLGVIHPKAAFDGFKNDVVIIIGTALVVSAAIARSGIIEMLTQPILPRLKSERSQVPVLVAATTVLSMVTKNVGALAILMPAALQVSARTKSSPSRLLMPMSFGSLVGGLVTLVGTSTNIIVSQVRQDVLGHPFKMFDFAPVGLCLALVIFAYLSFAYRLLPRSRQGAVGYDAALDANTYLTEARVPTGWTAKATTVAALRELGSGEIKITALVRDGEKRADPHPNTHIKADDILLLEGAAQALNQLIHSAKLILVDAERPIATSEAKEEVRSVEAVVGAGSVLIGRTARRLEMHQQFGVNLLAVSRRGAQVTDHLRTLTLRAGDVLLLQAAEKALPDLLKTLGCLPLAERAVPLGTIRRRLAPTLILAAAMVLAGLGTIPVAVAFFGAAVLVVAVGALSMREAYESLDAQVLVLVAALIPVSEAVRQTGGDVLVGGALSHLFAHIPPLVALGLIMTTAMLSSPFLHNAPTVLILGPVSVVLAKALHLNPDPFLMAVATGAGCDFLTPIGHQCNTLVMGPGGYRFSDYARLGAPLSVLVILLGAPLIAFFWPFNS